ncbi:hypothetical protein [Paraglaciecola arctica]|uniref:Uncharacterized protein n=1 Tax=Paraglaciecola arctica BSs20135 TaxID=493475 RepID=K6YIK9_9ALTE|nr:hypothetical protein [Paraglaciecola arctica]GAC18002.1 hypothetical protein GARC_1021 [Paraglaciecola arctica BSs20135]
MKYLLTLFCLFVTSNAMAHEDHALGESVHFAYHIAFWSLCALIAYKGIVWFKARKSKQNS